MKNNKVLSSLAYKFSEQLIAKGIGLVISVILARLLSPDDFGQLAILTVFINLSLNIIQGGLNSALVQSKNVETNDYSTVFHISLLLSIIMIVALYFLSPLIGEFYSSNEIVWPLRFYSLSLLFGSFNSVQLAKLQREMRFKETMYTRLIATVLSGAVGIYMAYNGFGIWALVAYNFAFIFFSCITMLFVTKWLPKMVFSKTRAKVLWQFGWKMLVSSLLCSIYNDVRSIIIGKKYSTEDLGYYSKGEQFPVIIASTIDTAIQSVMFPVLASIQEDKDSILDLLKKAIKIGALVTMPIMVGLALTSTPIISILLTEKWLPAVPYMQIICLADTSYSLASANLTVIKSMGRSDIYMKLEFVRRLVMIVILLASVFFFDSIMAIVIGFAISQWVDVIIISIPMKKILNYGFISQIKDIWKILIALIIMSLAVYLVGLINISVYVLLVLQILVGIIVYVLSCLILKEQSFSYLIKIASKLFRKTKG